MTATFVNAFRSEWLKRKRSFASALIIGGSLFTPAIIVMVRLLHRQTLPRLYGGADFWVNLWRSSWESMSVFFLPLAAILATSLMTQLELKSNTWKQVHALPVSTAVIYLAKLAVVLVMLAEFLILFTAGIYAAGMLPYALVPGVPHPRGSFLALPLLRENALYFAACLPIIAAQYLIAVRMQNVLVPIGIGFMAWVAALASVSSRFAVYWPYGYTIIQYIRDKPKGAHLAAYTNLHWVSLIAFVVVTAIGYALFVTRAEKG